jgi:hypothetical protein
LKAKAAAMRNSLPLYAHLTVVMYKNNLLTYAICCQYHHIYDIGVYIFIVVMQISTYNCLQVIIKTAFMHGFAFDSHKKY